MTTEDRVVTTGLLQRMHEEGSGELLVALGLLETLDPHGFHILVPSGHVRGAGEPRLVCEAQLAVTGGGDAICVDVMVTHETFEQLPPAFVILKAVAGLLPACVAEIEQGLSELGADHTGRGDA